MSNRKEFSLKTQREAHKRCCVDGVPHCEGKGCGISLEGRKFEYDHDDADYFSRDNSLANCVVLCIACHKLKTKTIDLPKIVKARAIYRTRTKTKSKGRPMMGTKASGWKHKVSGEWVRR